MQYISFFIAFALLPLSGFAQSQARVFSEHSELGQVAWHRDYNQALALSKESGKPVLLLFQEVPGCSTCRNYGKNVLSHPLMVEAIEAHFVPLAIFNNKKGKDLEILKKYKEPTWNNPVVRIVDHTGDNIIPRISGDYSAITLLANMKAVLQQRFEVIPEYLNLLEAELRQSQGNQIVEKDYKMYCFWSGEKELGKIDGVISTKSGFKGGAEVVKVQYDRSKISEKELDQLAQRHQCKPQSKGTFSLAKNDLHYYLQHTDYIYIPLTEIQKTKINSAIGQRKDPKQYLSPKQVVWLAAIQDKKLKKQSVFHEPFAEAWTYIDQQFSRT